MKACNFIKKRLQRRRFSAKFATAFVNIYFEEHVVATASSLLQKRETSFLELPHVLSIVYNKITGFWNQRFLILRTWDNFSLENAENHMPNL